MALYFECGINKNALYWAAGDREWKC